MAVLIGVLILVLLIMGLASRKRRTKAWVKEERYEESGNWLDKRPGERGTWGSLDQEMAQERGQLVRRGRAVELAALIRQYAAVHDPGFADLPEDQNRKFRSYTRDQATQMIVTIEQISQGKVPTAAPVTEAAQSGALKKQILDFAYQHYPALLDLDIDTIRQFDLLAGSWSETVIGALEKLKT
jgi:hypothetical protein